MTSTAHPDTDQVRAAWDGVAAQFDRFATPHSMGFGPQVLATLDLAPGTRVLDVAAGSGALAISAARTGADVTAVDLSPEMVRHLQARARSAGVTVDARVGDGQQLDLPDDAFDAVVSMNGISLFPDLDAGLREAMRVTRPGGRVLLVTFGPMPAVEFIAFPFGALQAVVPGFQLPPGPPPPPFRWADPTVMRASLENAGLVDVTVEPATWQLVIDDADHLLDTLLAGNPIVGELTAGVTEAQFAEVRAILDGMLRERSGGAPGAVLEAGMHVGTGTVT